MGDAVMPSAVGDFAKEFPGAIRALPIGENAPAATIPFRKNVRRSCVISCLMSELNHHREDCTANALSECVRRHAHRVPMVIFPRTPNGCTVYQCSPGWMNFRTAPFTAFSQDSWRIFPAWLNVGDGLDGKYASANSG